MVAFKTPILLNVFNRPEETRRVLEVLAQERVPILYVHCDGAREGRKDDEENVATVKQLIKERIAWPCEVHTMYEEMNYGCGMGPYRAMTWFFENVEEGIIIEDDCVPHPDFFMYCQELLERYRDNEEIGIIGGFQSVPFKSHYSYRFSAYASIWGWATWCRFWKEYDFGFQCTEEEFTNAVMPYVKSKQVVDYWLPILRRCNADGESKTYWDYQLHLQMLCKHKMHISPKVNLISNIGFGENATHTFDAKSKYANIQSHAILPLVHPEEISIYHRKDNNGVIGSPYKQLKRYIKRLFKKI